MNNLHRELAPISDGAWAQIEEEVSRTLKRYLAGRRVVDLHGPSGVALSAVGTGHLQQIAAPEEGIIARQRVVKPLVELRVPRIARSSSATRPAEFKASAKEPATRSSRFLPTSAITPMPSLTPSASCVWLGSMGHIRCCWALTPIRQSPKPETTVTRYWSTSDALL